MPRRARFTLLLLAALFLAPGCGRKERHVLRSGYRIKGVELVGVTRFDQETLLEHLHLGVTRWMPTAPTYHLDDGIVGIDADRIEALYRAYGFLDAKVLAVETRLDRRRRRAGLRIVVDEGPRTRVSGIDVRWAPGCPLPPPVREDLETMVTLDPGGPWEVDRLNATVGRLSQTLRNRGHPLARVRGSAEVHPLTRKADVVLEVDPGPAALLSGIRFEGLDRVPENLARNEIDFALGALYTPALIQQIETALKSTRVFRWVAVQPATEVDRGGVQVTIRVDEADPQSVRVGVRLAVETSRWQEQIAAEYTHTNLFGRLVRLDATVLAGWAELPNPWAPLQHGPAVSLVPRFTRKGLLEKHLIWELTPRFDVDIQEGYQYYSPANRIGVSRWFAGRYQLGVSHNIRFVDFFATTPALDAQASLLGRDFRDPFLLGYVELQAAAWFTDSILTPRNGVTLDASYLVAAKYLGSDYDFQRLLGGVRAWWRPWGRLQVAAKLRTGLILTFGQNPGAPLTHTLYLGGADTVRGWGNRRLSPRVEECDDQGTCTSIPVGGATMIQGNLELRLKIITMIHLVGFLDFGDVQAGQATWRPEEWNVSAGPGIRVTSPIGLLRLDAGFRLNDPGVYPDEPAWGIYFGFGETF
ncbi:MAG: BamA/TamA family outer membrane protein [Pseudomonadota bacterium]